jgi:hypothetical protein
VVCSAPAPYWFNPTQAGIRSAKQNVADGSIVLKIADAVAVAPASEVYFLIYSSTAPETLFNVPKFIATSATVAVPSALLPSSHYIAATAAQRGIADTIDGYLTKIAENLFLFPAAAELAQPLLSSDNYILTTSSAGFPSENGYLEIGNEAIKYSEIIDGYADGYSAFIISERDPFECDNISSHNENDQIALFRGFELASSTRTKMVEACGLPKPTWIDHYDIGLKQISDLGIGTAVRAEWFPAKAPGGFGAVFYNLYRATSLRDLFFSTPIGLSTELAAIVADIDPGKNYYFGIRAAYGIDSVETSGLETLSENFYQYPLDCEVDEVDGYFTSEQTGPLKVTSTSGFPQKGLLRIGHEILQYSSITSTTFNITNRDVFSIDLVEDYASGTSVQLFKGVEDDNFNYYRVVATWDKGDGAQLPVDGYAEYNQDEDGYRVLNEDIVTEDHKAFEEENKDFRAFDFSAYRFQNYVKLLSGNQCGTYSGGRRFAMVPGSDKPVPVAGGVNVFTAAQQREEIILGVTGEPFILLRRKTTGKRCPRLSLRSEHPHARCSVCMGTGFLGGYDRVINERELRPAEANPNGFIMARVSPYDADLELTPDRGLAQNDVIDIWTIAIPIIKDRDILIRYNFDKETEIFSEQFRYEVLSTNRNKLLFGDDGKQSAKLKKLDKTREVYKYSITLV